jgi:hypothetical protein
MSPEQTFDAGIWLAGDTGGEKFGIIWVFGQKMRICNYFYYLLVQ